MKRFILMAVFSLLFIATSTHAADKGMYFSGNVGLSFLSDSDNVYPVPGSDFESSYDLGFNIGGAVGYNFGNVRAEGEIAYHRNDVDEITFSGFPALAADGTVSAISFMVNGYYDFHPANFPLMPYLGGGIGVAHVNADYSALGIPIVDDSATVFAYQFMAGLGYSINPTTTLTAGYRYFATADPEFDDLSGIPPINYDSAYQSHEFNFGVRVAF